jgi:poly-gamma-glutamate system protein
MRDVEAAKPRRATPGLVHAAGLLALAYVLLINVLDAPPPALKAAMSEASALMARATAALRECRTSRGLPLDPEADPNGTGLVGVERSEITTSLGSVAAKRTTANPDFAALVVSLLHEAGVRRGDVVAVGASSSFPALIVATLAAAEAMGVDALVVSSLGASEWGANLPGFHWLDMEDCLRTAGLLDVRPVARALGGEGDVGEDMDPAGRARLKARLRAERTPYLVEPVLARNVAARLDAYRRAAGARPIKAFVNIGGSWANMGTDASVLELEPGLAPRVPLPPPERRGVIQAMAAAGVPIVHLLNVKGLCERYGLPWDPRPLPEPGRGGLSSLRPSRGAAEVPLSAGLVAALGATFVALRRRRPFFLDNPEKPGR